LGEAASMPLALKFDDVEEFNDRAARHDNHLASMID
jgi:hypothetical protein